MAAFAFSPLTPTAYLVRAARAFSSRTAVVDGDIQYTYDEFAERCRKVAGALIHLGVCPGDRVATLCVNSHVMLELHNAVPYAGGVLVPLNIRLSVAEAARLVRHSGAVVLVGTETLEPLCREIARTVDVRVVIDSGPGGEYDVLVSAAPPRVVACLDERGLLAISYTSGTTGAPKGVMYHHRGAYLQALAVAYHARLDVRTRYLWTLPQFHCDGWCFTWAVTAAGGTHVCLRQFDAREVWRLIDAERITHYCAAPTVLTMIANAHDSGMNLPATPIQVGTGGAPPSPSLLERMTALRMHVTHMYGLTETYGPVVVNDWQPEWDELNPAEQARLNARQGVGNVVTDWPRVIDTNGQDVPADGCSTGEVACRGNDVMLGYYRDEEATRAVEMDGWFRTGDIGVRHADGYLEIVDRAKDIIISGGENISSVEVERTLDAHPAVIESAVVGCPDELWGEVPWAFVSIRIGSNVTPSELRDFAREHLAHFKVPKRFVFTELPKSATGKLQKEILRRRQLAAPELDATDGLPRHPTKRQRDAGGPPRNA